MSVLYIYICYIYLYTFIFYTFILYTLYIFIYIEIFRDYVCKNFKSHLLEILIIHSVFICKCLHFLDYYYFALKFVLYMYNTI